MFKQIILTVIIIGTILILTNCGGRIKKEEKKSRTDNTAESSIQEKVAKFDRVRLTTDLNRLPVKDIRLLPLLFEAAALMDDIYWEEAYGEKESLLSSISDEDTKNYALINYGPWDRLDGNKPFIASYGEKPKGANFYPKDMTKEEFENLNDKDKSSEYTILRRDEKGAIKVIPYHIAFKDKVEKAASLMKQAAAITDNAGFRKYLNLRADALLTDKYYDSDMAWMDIKNSNVDFIIGPIENYEDGLYGKKAAHEAFILIKDHDWSSKLEKYTAMLPQLQKELPVEDIYKKEIPGTDSDINVYDAVYYAGDCNSGSKTIAINLPNDEKIQLKKGTRKLQLKNTMKAKFDRILYPIAKILIAEKQLRHIKFNAFFENVMFHEVAHGMGIKNTINGKGTVRDALKEQYSAVEEGKADILGLYLVTKLYEKGELTSGELKDNYVTFIAGIFRSVRFGAASAHGKANMECFNFMLENQAFYREPDGTYFINFDKMQDAVVKLVQNIIKEQGDGSYELAKKNVEENGIINDQLKEDLKRIEDAGIPVDIIFQQGKDILRL